MNTENPIDGFLKALPLAMLIYGVILLMSFGWFLVAVVLGLIAWGICHSISTATGGAARALQGAPSGVSILMILAFFAFWFFIVWLV